MNPKTDLDASYKDMSEDNEREMEAMEWCEAALIDVVISQSVICM